MANNSFYTPYLDSPYKDYSGYQPAFESAVNANGGYFDQNAANHINHRLTDLGGQFTSQFTNLVGRAPSADEINQFLQQKGGQIISGSPGGVIENDATNVRNQLTQYVGDTFQKQANDVATQGLNDQQGQANQLADLFRSQGRQAISNTEQSLMDYQSKLFEKLRPNLITSLDKQGLLDTGGLNEAMAGAHQNLANSAQGYLMDAHMNNENAANAIAFGGASAPYYFKQNQIMQQPGQLLASGQNALATNNNTYMDNLNYQHQLGLISAQANAQRGLQPGFLKTLGNSFANSLGQNAGMWFSPNPGGGGQSGPTIAKSLFP